METCNTVEPHSFSLIVPNELAADCSNSYTTKFTHKLLQRTVNVSLFHFTNLKNREKNEAATV